MMNTTHSNQSGLTTASTQSRANPTDAAPITPTSVKIDFTDEEVCTLLQYTRNAIEAAIRHEPFSLLFPPNINDASAFGLFVTLRRPTLLRACRGRWGGQSPTLGPLLTQVAHDTATLDPRFPSITKDELPYLAIDVSLMFEPAMVEATGEDRIAAIEIGKHGVVIDHPRGRGLLLPHVATEAGWDAKTFLDQLAAKAGLPPDTWRRDPVAKLMTFRTRLMTSYPPGTELDAHSLQSHRLQQLLIAVNQSLWDQPLAGEFDDDLTHQHEHEIGVYLQTESTDAAAATGRNQSLLDLAVAAAQSLKDRCTHSNTELQPVKRITLMWQPIRLVPSDYPGRHQLLSTSAILVRSNDQWCLKLPTRNTDVVGEALAATRMDTSQWHIRNENGAVELIAFSTLSIESREKPGGLLVRQPARSGQFYPSDSADMNRAIDAHLTNGTPPSAERMTKSNYRAIMLPHAGWVYCGDTIGKALSRINLPQTIIVVGPKHTPYGSTRSVPPHQRWNIPGAAIPIATDLIHRLVELVPGLDCEPEAHRVEHGCEVLLPFLYRLQPGLRVVPVVMGESSYEATASMANGLATLISEAGSTPPLLVISSDMNHFATDVENQRLDRIAIDAMLTGDPRNLFDACQGHRVGMCGLLPAVTVMQALIKTGPIEPVLIDYCTSAKVTKDTSRVVGYASMTIM